MPQISSFMFSEMVTQAPTPQGLKPAIVGPIQVLTPQAIPTSFTFGITFCISGLDTTKPHKLEVIFQNSSNTTNKTVLQNGMIAPLPQAPDVIPPIAQQGFVASINAQNVYLATEGEYNVAVKIDDEETGGFPIAVIKRGGAGNA